MEFNPATLTGDLKKRDWILITACWIILQLVLVLYLGINSQEESLKYIELSGAWISGKTSFHWNQLFYSGYVSLHVLLNLLGFPPTGMYFIQLFFSGLSVFYFVSIIGLFIQSRSALLFSGILYSSCFFIQQWVSALFTDSLFSSLLVIAIYFLLTEEKSSRNKFTCWLLLFILPIFRPIGFLFLLLACVYWLFISTKKNIPKLLICVLYLVLIGGIINKSLVGNPDYFYPNHNAEANIICGVRGDLLQYQQVPYRPGMSMFTFFIENPDMTVRLFFHRFIKIFWMTRSYFSPPHNIFLAVTSIIYLILAITGLITLWHKKNRLLIFLLAGIFIFSIPSVLFCQDWSGRFSLPVFCFVLLLSSFGISRIWAFNRSSSS